MFSQCNPVVLFCFVLFSLILYTYLYIKESQNGWCWKALQEVIWPLPCSARYITSWSLRTVSRQILKSSRWETLQLLWATRSTCSWQYRSASWCLDGTSCVPRSTHYSCSVTEHHLKEAIYVLIASSLWVFININKIPLEPSLLQAE